ncbi:MAG: class I SAM-dependent methyltransferase [Candidatus Aenigmatarchaeota archaeon]
MKLHLDVGCGDGTWMLDKVIKYSDLVFIGLDYEVTPDLNTNSTQGVFNLIKNRVVTAAHNRAYKEEHGFVDVDFLTTGDSENLHRMLSDPYRNRLLFAKSNMDDVRFRHSLHDGATYRKASYQEVLQETLQIISEHPRGRRMSKYKIGETYKLDVSDYPLRIDFSELSDMPVEEFLKSQPTPEFVNYYKPYTDRISFVVGDARNLPFADATFDGITVLNLGHDNDKTPKAEKQFDTLVDETSRVIKVGCKIVIRPVPKYMQEEYPNGMTIERTG